MLSLGESLQMTSALCSLEFVPCSLAHRDTWFFWPKNLDSLRVLVPHAVVQSVCSFGARFQENRGKKKKNNQDVHPLFFPFVQQAAFLPYSQILYPDSQDVGARGHHRCELHGDKKFFIVRFLSNSNSVLQQGGDLRRAGGKEERGK